MQAPALNHQIVLHSRPEGAAGEHNFRLIETPIPTLSDGEVLVRNHWLSVDPYMRGRMNDAKSYAVPHPLGAVMLGQTAGVVAASRSDAAGEGDHVVLRGGWQEWSVVSPARGDALRKVDATRHALNLHLGALGSPGITAWVGLVRICGITGGESVVVSAATGAVGSTAVVVARARGCKRVVGIAGGPRKCAYAVEVLGYDACVDYRVHTNAASLSAALADACPTGIDCYFENVGGMVQNAVLPRMNAHGRIAVCGLVAGYDGAPIPMEQPALLLTSRLRLQGFTVNEHTQDFPAALNELGALLDDGRLRPVESIAEGLASAPAAMLGLLQGRNLGKQLVRIAP